LFRVKKYLMWNLSKSGQNFILILQPI